MSVKSISVTSLKNIKYLHRVTVYAVIGIAKLVHDYIEVLYKHRWKERKEKKKGKKEREREMKNSVENIL